MYSTHNKQISVVAERFIRTLNTKTHRYMNSVSENVYIDKYDDIVNKYNNKFHNKIKMNPVDVKLCIYIEFDKKNKGNCPKFKSGHIFLISKYKNILAKDYTPNWSEKIFSIKKVKNLVPWTYGISDFNGEKLL